MKARDHIVLGGAASFLIYPPLSPAAIVFWLASVLIDVDHYVDFVYRNGFTELRVKKMFDYHETLKGLWRRPELLHISLFHTVEFIGGFYLLGLWTGSPLMKAALMGILFHIVLDAIFMARYNILFVRAYSITEYIVRRRRLLSRGVEPEAVYREALEELKEPGGG
ncbi:MAG: hypothetical protein V3W31_04675 [Thermodesulfobacteriota bacterium]